MAEPKNERLNVTRHNGDYAPPWVGDADAEDGRSIAENDAIQAEHEAAQPRRKDSHG
jgi:hypothetical protein